MDKRKAFNITILCGRTNRFQCVHLIYYTAVYTIQSFYIFRCPLRYLKFKNVVPSFYYESVVYIKQYLDCLYRFSLLIHLGVLSILLVEFGNEFHIASL